MRYTKYDIRNTKRAFTIIELVVAVAILVMMLGFTGVIFKVSIKSQRMAMANAEVMQKLRAITGQLNTDFGGLQKDAPLYIRFEREGGWTTGNTDPNRYDQMLFFASGDFESTQLYDDNTTPFIPSQSGSKIVAGNIARIHYAQAMVLNQKTGFYVAPGDQDKDTDQRSILNERERVLARRQHILTLEQGFYPSPNTTDPNLNLNDILEHDSISLAEWKANTTDPAFNNWTVRFCFRRRPRIDLNRVSTLHMLMAQGLGSFKIQWAYWDPKTAAPDDDELYWFPSEDPDGDPNTADSHFDPALHLIATDFFGVYFNVPGGVSIPRWYPIGNTQYFDISFVPTNFAIDFYPKALKFTFRLYDSQGLIEEERNGIRQKGRTFTHIVYLE